jgi:hypothetical protein
MRLLICFFTLCFLGRFGLAAFADPAEENPHESSDTAEQPQPIDLQNPPAKIEFRAPTLPALIALAKPTAVWDSDMLWVAKGADGRPRFSFCTAQWVELADLKPFWAVIRLPANANVLDDFETSDEQRDLPLVSKKPDDDGGAGDYAMLVGRDSAGDRVYELGCQNSWSGSGHCTEQRRIYVLSRRDGTWQFVGEGPSETFGRSGAEYADRVSVEFFVNFTHDEKRPVAIDFTATEVQDYGNPEDEDSTSCPPLESRSDATLSGALPATLRWIGRPYLVVEKSDSLNDIAMRITHWETDDSMSDRPALHRILCERAIRAALAELNPGLKPGPLGAGACVVVPSEAEITRLIGPPSPAWAATQLPRPLAEYDYRRLAIASLANRLTPAGAAVAVALLAAAIALSSRGIRPR